MNLTQINNRRSDLPDEGSGSRAWAPSPNSPRLIRDDIVLINPQPSAVLRAIAHQDKWKASHVRSVPGGTHT